MRVLVLLSGGQDSTTVLFMALAAGHEVVALSIDYGQRHVAELAAARKVVDIALEHYGERMSAHASVELPRDVLRSLSPLVSNQPLEQYSDFHSLPGGVEKTFVPLRNQLFLTIAANYAVHYGCEEIHIGVSQEDYGGYPDCRAEFLGHLQEAIDWGLLGVTSVAIRSPLLHLSKAATVLRAFNLKPCWEAMAYTHTAYDGRYPPTGKDHASLLRAKGFFEAGLPDPLVVRAVTEGLMQPPETSNYDALRPHNHPIS